MKKFVFWMIAFCLMLLASCSNEDLFNRNSGTYTLTATVEEYFPTSRAGFDLDNQGSFFWNNGDKIAIGSSSLAGFTTDCENGSTSATFTSLSAASGYAIYPYSGAQSINGTELTYKYAASYNYKSVDTDFFNGMSVDMPMWAQVVGNSLSFKHLGGVFAFKFPNLKAGENQTFTMVADKQISGEFTVDLNGDEPKFEALENETEADKKVCITFSLSADADAVFYVPVPVGIYEFQITLTNGTDTYTQEYKNLEVARRSIRYTTLTTHSLQGSEAKVVEDASGVTDAMAESNNVVVSSVTSESANSTVSIQIPKKDDVDANNVHSLAINAIDENTEKIEVKESATGSSSIKELVISVPSLEDAKKLSVDMPNTTVTIAVNGIGTMTLEEVTATTATNTLVVEKNVVIKKLIVKAGNVRIEEGAEVKNITRSTDNQDNATYVIYESETTPAITLGQNVTLMSAAEWDFKKALENNATSYQIHDVASLKLFRDAVNKGNTFEGCTIELMNDLDLNNENWTPIGFNSNEETGDEPYFSGTFDGKNHTINNLKIDVKDQGGVGLFGAVYNATFKDFTINNVDIKAVESEEKPEHKSGSSSGDNYYIVGGQLGAVAGYDAKNGTVTFDNVHVKGLIKIEGETRAKQGQRVAGVFGGKGSSVVSFNNVTVKGGNGSYIKGYCSTAGVMGQNGEAGTFTNVSTDIDVTCYSFGAGGIVGIACQGSTFTNCSSAGDITRNQPLDETKNSLYRIGGIAGCWSASNKAHTLTLTNCSYSGTLASLDADSKAIDNFDFNGLVGRAYDYGTKTIGSTVTIDGDKYVDEGSGIYSINDAYQIGTLAALKWFANEVNTGNNYFAGKTVKLTNDIDLNNEEWTPIGSFTQDHGFMGNFDGNGYVIKNLSISNIKADSDGWVYAGLFGITEGTKKTENNYINNYIKNLTIENVNISTEGTIVAAAIAYPFYTDIEDITVKGTVTIKGGDYTSGVLAYTRRCVNAKNLTIEANEESVIEGDMTVGGVISDIQTNGGLIVNYSNFKASGLKIKANMHVGGISGIISGQTLDGATVKDVTIVSEDARKGAVSGSLGETSTIKNISVTSVTGADNVVGATFKDGAAVTADGDVYKAE